MNRGQIFFAAILCVLGTTASPAQSHPKVVIGYLAVASAEAGAHFFAAFKAGLADHGLKEGQDFVIEGRWADSDYSRLEALAGEIARVKPRIVVAAPNPAVRAAAKVMPGIPVIQANGSDPVDGKLVKSLSRPGGMVTGLSNVIIDASERNLDLLLMAQPSLRRVGFLHDGSQQVVEIAERSAKRHRVEVAYALARKPEDLETALGSLASKRIEALIILSSGFFPSERARILKFANANRWPAAGGLKEYAEAGALVTYGADRAALYRRAAYYVDRILEGAKPGDLPIEQAAKFELVVNAGAARRLGITLPQQLLLLADTVLD